MKRFSFALATFCIFMVACVNQESNENDRLTNHAVQINPRAVEGEALFKVHCVTCHTLRYIEMQPDFSRKTWEKITEKMIKGFGAPIPDSSAALIVDYLITIKGIEEE